MNKWFRFFGYVGMLFIFIFTLFVLNQIWGFVKNTSTSGLYILDLVLIAILAIFSSIRAFMVTQEKSSIIVSKPVEPEFPIVDYIPVNVDESSQESVTPASQDSVTPEEYAEAVMGGAESYQENYVQEGDNIQDGENYG